jgi:4-hydroxy-tetrahydrodipicolinate synthase
VAIFPALSPDNRGLSEVAGRIPVIAGAGSNNTREAIALTQHAQRCGADAALHVTGDYNRPSQAGHIAHFNAVHEATDSPKI